ncbi:MAG: phosphoglycerate mutase family protein [Patescibacteria group bacterium]
MNNPNLEYVTFARHGECDDGGNLNDWGVSQIEDLGRQLEPLLHGGTVRIISSTAPRATQSAEILSRVFAAPVESYRFLWSGPSSPFWSEYDLKAAADLVCQSTASRVIMITHKEYVLELPHWFGENMLGEGRYPSADLPHGGAVVIDCKKRDYKKLTPEV